MLSIKAQLLIAKSLVEILCRSIIGLLGAYTNRTGVRDPLRKHAVLAMAMARRIMAAVCAPPFPERWDALALLRHARRLLNETEEFITGPQGAEYPAE